jgi:hypothetical protein
METGRATPDFCWTCDLYAKYVIILAYLAIDLVFSLYSLCFVVMPPTLMSQRLVLFLEA